MAPPSRQQVAVTPKEKSNEYVDNYGDDFEDDIAEDIPDNDDTDNLLGSGNNYPDAHNANSGNQQQHRSGIISESMGGITVS